MTGTTEASIIYGGSSTHAVAGTSGCTEEWNGTSWTEKTNFSANRAAGGSFGTAEACFLIGGSPPSGGGVTTVEEWTAPVETTVTFTAS